MKNILFMLVFIAYSSSVFGFCIAGRGTTCSGKKNEDVNNQTIIYTNSSTPPNASQSDGGISRKIEKGDKSQEQGYSEYKQHFIYYGYHFYSTPSQNYLKKSASTGNRSIGYEYAFNPFVSFKAEQFELNYKGVSDQEMKQKHTALTINLRRYLLDVFVLRAGIGLAKTDINKSGEGSSWDTNKSGTTEVLQISAFYIFGDEDTMLGVSSTTFTGLSGTENIGSSSYAIVGSIGFR